MALHTLLNLIGPSLTGAIYTSLAAIHISGPTEFVSNSVYSADKGGKRSLGCGQGGTVPAEREYTAGVLAPHNGNSLIHILRVLQCMCVLDLARSSNIFGILSSLLSSAFFFVWYSLALCDICHSDSSVV